MGPISGLCQVIIKNTHASKSILHATSSTSINRSQSLLMTNRIPVLAPSRTERIRLEALLSDVWSRDILPFPGINGRVRNEHLVRASASSMMRKLSVASIASNFTKRSGSMASLQKPIEDEMSVEIDPPKISQAERRSSEAETLLDANHMMQSQPAAIRDKREGIKRESVGSATSTKLGSDDSPAGSIRRTAAKHIKDTYRADGPRITTPPLQTSSANSPNHNRATTMSTGIEVPSEDKENVPQVQLATKTEKHGRRRRAVGRNRVMVEGIRSFFR